MKNCKTMNPLAALVAVLCLLATATTAPAVELLSNGGFESPGTGDPATDWTPWSWGNGWANTEQAGWGSGSYHIAVGASGGGGGGFYQIVPGAPGVEFTLSVLSGADAWWLPTGRMIMFFLDSTNGVISEVSRLTVDPAEYGTNYDIAHPWSNYTLVATSPADTAFVKVEFACNESIATPGFASGSVGFDDASLTAPIDPPVITNVHPNGLLMLTNMLSFTARSTVPIDASGIEVLLNGVDISGSLAFTGAGTTNVSASYSGLQSNTVYAVVITVTDSANLASFKNVSFDTYVPIFTWEAEDYNFGGGGYINDPTPSDSVNPGVSYFGEMGFDGIDFHDHNAAGPKAYRGSETMSTAVAADGTRQKFLAAVASDYTVGYFSGSGFTNASIAGIEDYDAGEWVNYTREFPAGTYNIYGRLARDGGGTGTLRMSRVTSPPNLGNQTTEALGVFRFPEQGWTAYTYAPLTDEFGNAVQVVFTGGAQTLRVSSVQDVNLNFFMLMPVDTEQPTLTDVYPNGRTLLQGTNTLRFTASSASHSIAQSNVVVTLNGVDLSGSLSFSGSPSSWNVSGPLQLGVTNYTAVIGVTDDVGNSHSVTVYFDTFDPAGFVIEAEDFDFAGGQFIDNPQIASVAGPNTYFEDPLGPDARSSWSGVDSYGGDNPPAGVDGTWRWRAGYNELIRTDVNGDTPLQKLLDAQATNALAFNYNVSYLRSNSWLNYTRTYPTGEFNVYARLASDPAVLPSFSLLFDEVSNVSTNHLGNFVGSGRGWGFFDWIPLVNTNGALAKVTLNGETTLRLTTPAGEVNPNSFLFVPAVTLPADLQWSYAGGTLTLTWNDPAFKLQSQTNAPGAGISTGWSDYPGGTTSPVNVTVDPSKGSLFFRLKN